VQGIVFEEEEDPKQSDDPSPRKKSVASQADVERLLIKWVQDILKGQVISNTLIFPPT
jgi:hypothetical protein